MTSYFRAVYQGLCYVCRVRETFDFAARVQGVGHKRLELEQLLAKEREAGIEPDHTLEAFMQVCLVLYPTSCMDANGRKLCMNPSPESVNLCSQSTAFLLVCKESSSAGVVLFLRANHRKTFFWHAI